MSRIGIIGKNSPMYIETVISIWNNNDCAVLIDWHIPFEIAVKMLIEAGVSKCFIEKNIYKMHDPNNTAGIELIEFKSSVSNPIQKLPREIYDCFKERYDSNEALLLYSSGTTGENKGIVLSHYAINTNADSIIKYMRLNTTDSIAVVKLACHSSVIVGEVLVALKSKANLYMFPDMISPREVLKNINLLNITILCLNPTLLDLYINSIKSSKYSSIYPQKIYISGDILSKEKYITACEKFGKDKIYNVYGLTEAGPRVCSSSLCKDNKYTNSVGKPINGVQIKLVNKNGEIAETGEIGEIHIKTQSKFSGYINQASSIQSVFDDWFNSNDMGYFDEDGDLYIIGRSDDMIVFNSHNIFPNDITTTINKFAGIKDSYVLLISNENKSKKLCCVYEGKKIDVITLRRFLECKLAYYEIPSIYINIDKIPKNVNGKYDKQTITSFVTQYLSRMQNKNYSSTTINNNPKEE